MSPWTENTQRPSVSDDGHSKRCSACRTWKPLEEFNRDTSHWTGHSHRCRSCAKARLADLSPEYRRRQRLKRYGITPEEYDRILAAQGGGCGICGGPLPPYRTFYEIDHDHFTGLVRGLLCPNCNLGLGQFQDSKELLLRALAYLKDGR